MPLFLLINSTIQSNLHYRKWRQHLALPAQHRRQQLRCLVVYGTWLTVITIAAMAGPFKSTDKAVLLGTTLPGAGFLQWAIGDQFFLVVILFSAGLCAFGVALILWFTTGNMLAPLAAWVALAWLAGQPELLGVDEARSAANWPFIVAPAVLIALALLYAQRRDDRVEKLPMVSVLPQHVEASSTRNELSLDDLRRLRLLFDRALQPVERFNGFERRDQFQTAALRYQVNFVAYALALAWHRYAPAADTYFLEAQRRLLAKIGDRRLWSYWRLENAWGNLQFDADPVPHQNIMYSGFTTLQMALGKSEDLALHDKGREWRRYRLKQIASLFESQYRASSYGLLTCEPNWIYPLCNLISMSGIRAADARLGTNLWPCLSKDFLESLRREGMRADGSFIAFRSARTGIAPPSPGGIVMQTFPCLFLNTLSPELAQEHWSRVRTKLDSGSWRRLFWPVDIGNYGLSRASSYAATAVAAVEMGDHQISEECLRRLDIECPPQQIDSVIHRERASLWAHALELMARFNSQDGLNGLTSSAPSLNGPRLIDAPYPDVLVAQAHADDQSLKLVLHPGTGKVTSQIKIGGLIPRCQYQTDVHGQPFIRADHNGAAALHVSLRGRTSVSIEPVCEGRSQWSAAL